MTRAAAPTATAAKPTGKPRISIAAMPTEKLPSHWQPTPPQAGSHSAAHSAHACPASSVPSTPAMAHHSR